MAVLERSKDFELRDAGPDDLPFVRSTWLRDYRERSSFARRIDAAEYQLFHRLLLDRIQSRSRTVVAYDVAAPEVLWGWVCSEPGNCLHYVFVKRPFRNMGLGRALLQAALWPEDGFYTHQTYCWEGMVHQKFPAARFSPYRL
jgi:GNAT superfamily N-acetyltransferase